MISQVNTTTIVRVVGSQLLTRGSLINIFENQFSLVNRLPEDSIAVSILQDYAPHGDYNIAEVMVIMATYCQMVMVILVIGGYQWLSDVISDTEK